MFAMIGAAGLGAAVCLTMFLLTDAPLPGNVTADQVIVLKSQRKLRLIQAGKLLKQYSIALGHSPIGPKRRAGDGRTPEGHYRIDLRNSNSGYHLSLRISYPNARDRAQARAAGKKPGGALMIHGIKNGFGWIGRFHRLVDWTNGCIAVTNPEMDEIWRAVPKGTPVDLRP